MGSAIKHPVPDRVKASFVIFDIQALRLPAQLDFCSVRVYSPLVCLQIVVYI